MNLTKYKLGELAQLYTVSVSLCAGIIYNLSLVSR